MERMSGGQEELLRGLVEGREPGSEVNRFYKPRIQSLADDGFITNLDVYLDGQATFRLTDRAFAYFEQLEREDKGARRATRHDWALNAAGGAWALLGAVTGYLLARIAG